MLVEVVLRGTSNDLDTRERAKLGAGRVGNQARTGVDPIKTRATCMDSLCHTLETFKRGSS